MTFLRFTATRATLQNIDRREKEAHNGFTTESSEAPTTTTSTTTTTKAQPISSHRKTSKARALTTCIESMGLAQKGGRQELWNNNWKLWNNWNMNMTIVMPSWSLKRMLKISKLGQETTKVRVQSRKQQTRVCSKKAKIDLGRILTKCSKDLGATELKQIGQLKL